MKEEDEPLYLSKQEIGYWFGVTWIETNYLGPWWYKLWVRVTRFIRRA